MSGKWCGLGVWALLYDPVVRGMWLIFPCNDLWITVFADDVALALRNVFRDLAVLRRYMNVVKVGTGSRSTPTRTRR